MIITLEILDPNLFSHLLAHGKPSQFTQISHMVFSFGGSTPGIEGLLHAWDFLMSFGFCINPIMCALRIIQIRETLMKSKFVFLLNFASIIYS